MSGPQHPDDLNRPHPQIGGPDAPDDVFEEDAFDRPTPPAPGVVSQPSVTPSPGSAETDKIPQGGPAVPQPPAAPAPPAGERKPIEFEAVPSPWKRRGSLWKRRNTQIDDTAQSPRVLEISDGQASAATTPRPDSPTSSDVGVQPSTPTSEEAPAATTPGPATPGPATPGPETTPGPPPASTAEQSSPHGVAPEAFTLRTGAEPASEPGVENTPHTAPPTPLIWGGSTAPSVARNAADTASLQSTAADVAPPGTLDSPAPQIPPGQAPPGEIPQAHTPTDKVQVPQADLNPRLEHTPATDEQTDAAFGVGTARRTILVTLIGLILAALLNAQSIADTANRQPYGWRHDYATAVADPLLDVSDAMKLTQPRIWIDDLLNRENDPNRAFRADGDLTIDQGDIASHVPDEALADTTSTTVNPTTTTLPSNRTIYPGDPLRVWVGGDSLAYEMGIGLDRTNMPPWMNVTVDSRHSTGLTRPDVFDWVSYLTFQINSLQSEAIVFTAGINDKQPILVNGQPAQWNTPEWRAGYAARIQMLVDGTRAQGRHFYWVGQPAERRDSYTENIEVVNEIAQQVAAGDPDMTYLDGWAFFTPDGKFVSDRTNASGVEQAVRRSDGIHLTFDGGEQFATVVRDHIMLRWPVDLNAFSPTTTVSDTASTTTTTDDGLIIITPINPAATTTTTTAATNTDTSR